MLPLYHVTQYPAWKNLICPTLGQNLGTPMHLTLYLTEKFFPYDGRANACLVCHHPHTSRQLSASVCCDSSMRGSYNALGIFCSFHHRPHPFLSIRCNRGQEQAHSAIKKQHNSRKYNLLHLSRKSKN